MRKLFALAVLVCMSAEAPADDFYGEISSGVNFLQTKTNGGIKSEYNTGYIVSGFLGYSWCYGIRFEAEYAYRRNSLKSVHFFGRTFSIDGHFQSSSFMANVLWDIPVCWDIQPIIGGGIGYDIQRIHGHNESLVLDAKKRGFAWELIGALSYPLFCNANVSLEYKFHRGGFNYINSHSLGIGLLYKF